MTEHKTLDMSLEEILLLRDCIRAAWAHGAVRSQEMAARLAALDARLLDLTVGLTP